MLSRGQGPQTVAAAVSSLKGLPIGGASPFLPALAESAATYPRHVFTGKTIDEVYGKSQDQLVKLKEENK